MARRATASWSSFLGLCALALSGSVALAQRVVWREVRPAADPGARISHAMAFDESRGVCVLFGGIHADGTRLADTWVWGGVEWQRKTPAHSPSARTGHALAFDTVRDRIVLFGGNTNAGQVNDTWEWDGTDWSQRVTPVAPDARQSHAMAFDAGRRVVVLFGGSVGSTERAETWTWDGSAWQQQAPARSPSGLANHAMCWDGRVVLFGGSDNSGAEHDDTWVWDGVNWTRLTPANPPGERRGHALAFDGSRGRAVMFAGRTDTALRTGTVEWDGVDWSTGPTGPAGRYEHAMAYDSLRRRVVLFGGEDLDAIHFGDTWEYFLADPATFTRFGTGCGVAGMPVLDAAFGSLPCLGERFTMVVDGILPVFPCVMLLGFDRTSLGGVPLPIPLDVLGMTGCLLHIAPMTTLGVSVAGTWGRCEILMPSSVDLLGAWFYAQALAFDPTANPGGAVLSNAGEARIGAR